MDEFGMTYLLPAGTFADELLIQSMIGTPVKMNGPKGQILEFMCLDAKVVRDESGIPLGISVQIDVELEHV